MRIFLVAGRARSGKGEVAKSIKAYYDKKGEKSVITEYSKYIKLFATEMTSWNGALEDKPRKFLQDMGTYIRNNLKMPNFFLHRMQEDIKIYEHFYENIIIADVRLPIEIEEMKKKYSSVYSIYVINEHGNYDLTIEEASHETEHAFDHYNNFDFMIVNDENDLLNQKIEELLEGLEHENN